MPGPVVSADALSKRWGDRLALDGATFEIGNGITGLLGANGAGKTTLLGLVLGMHPPDGGSLQVLGRNPTTAGPEVRAHIGYAPEHDPLPGDVRAHDLVRHFAEVHGLPRREAQTRASDALYEVGLGEERFRAVETMSTGQRQRVKLAVAIAHDPELVLLDEPTNGLDPMQREQMLTLIRRIGTDLGLDVVLSSHLLDEVERVCDSVVILDVGRVVRTGRLTDLREPDTAELLIVVDGADETAALIAELGRRGAAAVLDGDRIVVAVEGEIVFDLVRDAIADLGVPLRRLERRTTTLEDVFLAGPVRAVP